MHLTIRHADDETVRSLEYDDVARPLRVRRLKDALVAHYDLPSAHRFFIHLWAEPYGDLSDAFDLGVLGTSSASSPIALRLTDVPQTPNEEYDAAVEHFRRWTPSATSERTLHSPRPRPDEWEPVAQMLAWVVDEIWALRDARDDLRARLVEWHAPGTATSDPVRYATDVNLWTTFEAMQLDAHPSPSDRVVVAPAVAHAAATQVLLLRREILFLARLLDTTCCARGGVSDVVADAHPLLSNPRHRV